MAPESFAATLGHSGLSTEYSGSVEMCEVWVGLEAAVTTAVGLAKYREMR